MDYCQKLVKRLNEFRREGHHCDVNLIVQGQGFPAHRLVLSASCPFFEALFASEMKEKEERNISLESISVTIMEPLLHYLYTGVLEIADECVAQDLVVAGDFLLSIDLKKLAVAHLVSSVDKLNCVSLLLFADKFECQSLRESARTFIIQNFQDVVCNDNTFLALKAKQFSEIISSDELVVDREEVVFEALIQWVRNNQKHNSDFAAMFSHIRLFSIAKNYRTSIIAKEDLVKNSESCQMALSSSERYSAVSPYEPRPRQCLDEYEDAIFVCSRSYDSDTFCFIPAEAEWYHTSPVPHGKSWHSVVFCDGYLFVLSGRGRSTGLVTIQRFDPLSNCWSDMVPLLRDVEGFGTGVLHGCVYVVGGQTGTGNSEEVQRFDPRENIWERTESLKPARSGSCVVSQGDHLYAIGGSGCEGFMNNVERYDPTRNSWSSVSSMTFTRSQAAATVIGESIYVISGHSEESDGQFTSPNDVKPVNTCEIYNIETNTWSLISRIHRTRSDAGICSVSNMVYIFGGDDLISMRDREETMECFDLVQGEWREPLVIPVPVTGPRACAMRMRKNLISSLTRFTFGTRNMEQTNTLIYIP